MNKPLKPLSFDLVEISKWQLEFKTSKVELPALQRGFVWKVNQIESLWDSILRGFPVGSFLLSQSEDSKLFLLDGQQRATSITLGFYDPWHNKESEKSNSFWSLKNIPVVWIDLSPKTKTKTQKFVIRVVTQSHPWGYQRAENNKILIVADRRNALKLFKNDSENKKDGYVTLSSSKVFPYDADLPVPLAFVIKAIFESEENWKNALVTMCKDHLPNITTKHSTRDNKLFSDRLAETLNDPSFDSRIFAAIKNLQEVEIPGIVVQKEILKDEDEQSEDDPTLFAEDDPTLFVRLNSSGTRIAGEELIYSIYKASFPEAKNLVENIGASFIAPSLVISLIARLAQTELSGGLYQQSINVNNFRQKIKKADFKQKMKELIGNDTNSPSTLLFKRAIDLIRSENVFDLPPVLVKSIIKSSPDLFLMLLQWLKLNGNCENAQTRKRILATITALHFFCKDKTKFTEDIWGYIYMKDEFWTKNTLGKAFINKRNPIMYPLIQPSILREYLILHVVEHETRRRDKLYPNPDTDIMESYKKILKFDNEQENEVMNLANNIWDNFTNALFGCKPLVMFAQRKYINDRFKDFNQMETLQDTNAPWDWDHIYPISWVKSKQNIDYNTRHWTNSIGNFRALSLEENRSENNSLSPKERLAHVREQSFIKDNDWAYWKNIGGRINDNNKEMVAIHLSAIIHRFCNIYEEWYATFNIEELFDY